LPTCNRRCSNPQTDSDATMHRINNKSPKPKPTSICKSRG